MADIETLVIGGIIALISSFVTYLVSHYLKIREQTIATTIQDVAKIISLPLSIFCNIKK